MTPTQAIPARILRRQADRCVNRPPQRERDRQRQDYILGAARNIFATHGRAGITLRNLADAIDIGQAAIRHQVCDLHHLFALILTQHLDAILIAIGQIPDAPGNPPDPRAPRRAEYLRLTRETDGTLTRLYVLFLHERFALPPDELEPLEQHRRIIGHLLGGEAWEETLALLDCPALDHATIEAMLQTRAAHIQPHAAAETQAAARPKPMPIRPRQRELPRQAPARAIIRPAHIAAAARRSKPTPHRLTQIPGVGHRPSAHLAGAIMNTTANAFATRGVTHPP